ncbi:L-type lectin-domain containing receptor kinase IV.1-like [Lycium barbarum]|uniref:L-type lectin-domain containing receptor kinase IV.1-like n=1 Tax=Lycium barbarum TaxID=112863 RepID=UPI00293F0BE7|nr:L-type lectin-domain containing receptor kinase IV.1-like [Lycium barbarum]
MSFTLFLLVIFCALSELAASEFEFAYNGFKSANMSVDGLSKLTSNGLLKLTNSTTHKTGHAFNPNPINFKNNSDGPAYSFSTCFVFAVVPEYPTLGGHGLAFVMEPTKGLPGGLPSHYIGLFSDKNNGNITNHVVAVEFDTILSREFEDINDNHVGININQMKSEVSKPAGYYVSNDRPFQMTLISGQIMQAWVEYDAASKQIHVTLAPVAAPKQNTPLLSLSYDLSPIVEQTMYIGFSAATGSVASSHYILGWSFKINGMAAGLDISKLPKLPRIGPKKVSRLLSIGLPVIFVVVLLVSTFGVVYLTRRKMKFAELLEDWELEYGPHRFKYKELYMATRGFKEMELLGSGGFGSVYRGVLPSTKMEIAVKKVSHESRQGMRSFIAEIVSMGRLRHRNLVPLLGYCRRNGELLLVYEYMPSGSLDKYLYGKPIGILSWSQRFHVIKGVASGLFYLHEEWEQVVVHRDIKASNVLLDSEFNGRLGDFGLARLYDHGTDPYTTHVVGTIGYLAPEHTKTGKATTSSDVFSFGAFLLEVACGKRPIDPKAPSDEVVLLEWVFSFWRRSELIQVVDPKMGCDFVPEEVELVLKLGLLCSSLEPSYRPSMRQIILYLEGSVALPEFASLNLCSAGLIVTHTHSYDEMALTHSSSVEKTCSYSSSISNSLLSGGR